MNQSTRWNNDNRSEPSVVKSARCPSFLKFLVRYSIFFLAFGPPLFRSARVDATKGVIDVWSFCQVGLLSLVAIRAMYRLASAQSIMIPKPVRSILKLSFLLGLLYLASAIYSPSSLVSAAYSFFNFLTLVCVVEFVVDVRHDPPDWIQCLIHLRFISLLLLVTVLAVLPFRPGLVLVHAEGAGIRLLGGAVAPLTWVAPVIAIISAYTYLHGLESKGRSAFYFMVGTIATLITQARGAELALFLSLAILGAGWARTGRRSTYFFLSSLLIFTPLLIGAAAAIGGGRIWSVFNRGQSAEGIASASGRIENWKFVIQYCSTHPQGMGYVAGFRILFKEYYVLGVQLFADRMGNAHNAYMQTLADAGWLAVGVYLVLLVKIILLGLRFAKKSLLTVASDSRSCHAIRCSLLLLVFCLAVGMDGADSCVPLREPYYLQNITIAIILGISARQLAASSTRNISSFR